MFRVIAIPALLYAVLFTGMLSVTEATKCAEVNRTPQTQPPSYLTKKSPKSSRHLFEKHDKSNVIYNGEIPAVCEEAMRVATFNIHYHRDLHDQASNTKDVAADLQQFDPTVVIFQEVVADPDDRARMAFDQMLDGLGYLHRVVGASQGAWLGNMIASKYPLQSLGMLDLGSHRAVHAAAITVGGRKVGVVGTHLEVSSSNARLKEAQKIVTFLQKYVAPHCTEYILGGDMNAHWGSPEIKQFVEAGTLKEVFGVVKAPYPQYTCWAGRTIDFLFASPNLAPHLAGSYIYHTISSDHLPVMTDILLPKVKEPVVVDDGKFKAAKGETKKSEGSQSWYSNKLWMTIFVIVVIIFLVGGGWAIYRLVV